MYYKVYKGCGLGVEDIQKRWSIGGGFWVKGWGRVILHVFRSWEYRIISSRYFQVNRLKYSFS